MSPWLKFVAGVAIIASLWPTLCAAQGERVQFNRDIRPILSENCFHCHGQDAAARKAGLRLDTRQGVSAAAVIMPGKPDESELIARILDADPDYRMPPPHSHRQLTVEQKELLRRWVAEGAPYDEHWAFQAAARPTLPEINDSGWPRNEIDHFILARLEAEGLDPSPPAPVAQLLRRAAFDLTGLPPERSQLRHWMQAEDPLQAAVEELLDSPRFGERMASDWLDVARYADSHGFNNDSTRTMWRWRDWVIEAFNANMPYDQFIKEQLAGDLLPEPTLDQRIATAFNRNHVINSEGGIIGEEYRLEYVADRVRTVSLAWLGLTMDCARCHDHKYDPISQKEYFEMFAFFNNIDEHGEAGRRANAAPLMAAPTAQQQQEMKGREAELREVEAEIQRLLAAPEAMALRIDAIQVPETTLEIAETNRMVQLALPEEEDGAGQVGNSAGGKPFQVNGALNVGSGPPGHAALLFDGATDLRTAQIANPAPHWAFSAWVRRDEAVEGPLFSTMDYDLPRSFERFGRGVEIRFDRAGAVEVRLVNAWPSYSMTMKTRERVGLGDWTHLLVFSDGSATPRGLRVFLDGEEAFREVLHEDFGNANIAGAARIGSSGEENSRRFAGALADYRLMARPNLDEVLEETKAELARFAMATFSEKGFETLADALENEASHDSAIRKAAGILRRLAVSQHDSRLAAALQARKRIRNALLELERQAPSLMVMRELPEPRDTFVLIRGEYDNLGETVEAGVPGILFSFPEELPRNRFGLARWLTDPRHPLTSRVVVNRFWQEIFGTGLVKSAEDFGFQGDWPSHPELLDWLATEFIARDWNVKEMFRLLITSATYRQDSRSAPELNERDPENRLLARGPRRRLTAEMLRDQALAVSGLLHEQMGGPPVFPYQPENFYSGVVVDSDLPGTKYVQSEGAGLHRRSLYTFWKRTVPHPSLALFDAPDREFCIARRTHTNTPLQALALMNDTIQLEAARKLAERLLHEGGASAGDRIRFAFQLATAREPDSLEIRLLQSFLEDRVSHYREAGQAAEALLAIGDSKRDESLDPAELAAYANVASLILNLDETLHRN